MATLEKRGDSYRVIFYYRNERFTRSLKTDNPKKANGLKSRLEESLSLLEQGRLEYDPKKDDLPTLLLSDGKLNARPEPVKRITLGEFFKLYQNSPPPGKEANTTYTEGIHIKHLLRLLGPKTALANIPGRLQAYVTARSAEQSRLGGAVSQATIKKELGTLTSIWNRWGINQQHVSIQLSLRNLEYPKKDEKPPFQTWEVIERRIALGGLTHEAQADLWESLFLTIPEIEDLLLHVKTVKYKWQNSSFPWVYPMFAFCAYTGARRSEMLRSRVEDLDFDGAEILIRERKKDRSKKETSRRVPMVPQLHEALKEWLAIHPGGPPTFCKKAGEPFTAQMATHYLRWALDGSKWLVVCGWHILRHSLISNMVSRGVPERVLMAVAGHLNAETSRRYQHLLPSTVRDAMCLVFGDRAIVPKVS
jgi:integrase